MDWINQQIAIGDIDDAMQRTKLDNAGITAILSLNGFPRFLSSDGFSWHHTPLIDGPGNPLSSLQAALQTLHLLISRGHKVLVHCAEGTSRSPFVVACHLATYHGLQFSEALELVAEKRPFVAVDAALSSLHDLL